MTWWQMRFYDRGAHVNRVRTAWVRAGAWVRFGPVEAVCRGLLPRRVYGRGAAGAVGIVGDALVFAGQRSSAYDVRIPAAKVQRLSLVTVRLRLGRRARALAVHYDSPDGWRVATLSGPALAGLAEALAEVCNLPVHNAGDGRDDFGPDRALRLVQDVYGQWSADRQGELYLAPDRLLFDWRIVTPLEALARLDVYPQEGRRGGALLRVTWVGPDGVSQVEGFQVRRASQWAEALQRRADAPVQIFAGRKRKNDGPDL